MIDLDQLESLAKAYPGGKWEETYALADRWQDILTLITELRTLRSRLELDPRTGIDGIEARDVTIRGLEQFRVDAARYDFLRARAELRQYDMGNYWYIKTVDVPMGMPLQAATLANVIDFYLAKGKS